MSPRPGYRERNGLFVALALSQMRHTVAIWRVLRIVAQCHPDMMDEALAALA